MTTDAGTNWSLLKDVALCTSWVEVTHNSLTGNEMQLREMWSLIHTKFLEQMSGKRTKESMSSRWKILSHSFSTWRDALTQASSNVRSGANYADEQLQAQAWYAAKIKSRNKSFNRWECWNIVKDYPKFKVVPVGPEVCMNNIPLHSTFVHNTPPHSTPDHGSHVDEEDGEEVPETPIPEQASGSTRYPIRPQGKKASKRKGSASKNDYGKYMQELARQGELMLARELAKYEAEKARDEVKATTIQQAFQAEQRERELLRQERELLKEERIAQRDRDIMNKRLEGMSPNSKYFWQSEKADVVQRRRAREARSRQDGPSTTRQDDPSTTDWLSDDK
ncbi:hypothetical protein ACFX2H_013875 [Malus domestica]